MGIGWYLTSLELLTHEDSATLLVTAFPNVTYITAKINQFPQLLRTSQRVNPWQSPFAPFRGWRVSFSMKISI